MEQLQGIMVKIRDESTHMNELVNNITTGINIAVDESVQGLLKQKEAPLHSSEVLLHNNGLKWTRTTDLTLIRRAL